MVAAHEFAIVHVPGARLSKLGAIAGSTVESLRHLMLRPSAKTAALAMACALCVSTGGPVADATAKAAHETGSKSVRPGQLLNDVVTYYSTQILSGGDVGDGVMTHITHLVLGPHLYEASATCSDNPYTYSSVQYVRDDIRGDYEITCQKGPNGKYLTTFIPRQRFGSTVAARNMDLRIPLQMAGARAANTNGISDFGPPKHVDINIDYGKHTAAAVVTYGPVTGPQQSASAPVRGPKKIQIHVANGRVLAHVTLFG